jgi:hypothetical protein
LTSAPSAARARACDARGKITKAGLDALERGEIRADTEVKGFVARRLPSGVVTYGLRYRAAGRHCRTSIMLDTSMVAKDTEIALLMGGRAWPGPLQ